MADSENIITLPEAGTPVAVKTRRRSALMFPKPKHRPRVTPGHLRDFIGSPAHPERLALRTIVERGDLIEVRGSKFLLVPVTDQMLDALAGFEADLAEIEQDDEDACTAHDDDPARRHWADLAQVFGGDSEDSEDDDPGGGNIDDVPHDDPGSEAWHVPARDRTPLMTEF